MSPGSGRRPIVCKILLARYNQQKTFGASGRPLYGLVQPSSPASPMGGSGSLRLRWVSFWTFPNAFMQFLWRETSAVAARVMERS